MYDFLLGNFNLENEGLRCCWWGEVKLIQNSSFLFHSHYSPRFPEKKVGKNTFRAFTGKLEKPINLRCRGGDASLGGWMILTSLENEQSASYGYAISLQIIFLERRTRRCIENYREKSGFVSVVDKSASWVVLSVRHDEKGWLPSPSVCTKTCRKFVFTLFFPSPPPLPSPLFQTLMSALSLGWNRIPLSSAALLSACFSGTMTSILPDISGKIRIFLKEDISRKRGCRVISLSRSNRVSFIFGCAGTKVAILEMGWRMANLF